VTEKKCDCNISVKIKVLDDLIMYVGLFCHSAVAFNGFMFFRVFMFYGLSVWLCFFQ